MDKNQPGAGQILSGSATGAPNYSTVEEIKQFRVDVDALIQRSEKLYINKAVFSKQNKMADSKVCEHLIEAKMWLGKCLEAMGSPFPKELADKAEIK